MKRWIILAVILAVQVPGVIWAHRAVETETFERAGESPDIVHLKIVDVQGPGCCRADVLQSLKGRALPGSRFNLMVCCDFHLVAGDELVLMTDLSGRQVLACGQEGGLPSLRRCLRGSVLWDEGGGAEVPLWLWKQFLPKGTRPRPPLQGG